MKKITILLLLFIFIFSLYSCKGKNKEVTYSVTIHYDEIVETVSAKENSLVDFDPLNDTNYLFLGWYNEDYSICLNNSPIKSNMDIYAKVVKYGTTFNITFDLDDGIIDKAPPKTYNCGEEITLPSAHKEKGFEFAGWECNGEIITKITDTTYGDLLIKAKWIDLNTYHTITYVLEDDEIYENAITILREGDSLHLGYPTKEYYYFRGWYLEPTFETRIKDIDETNVTDLTLYPLFVEADRLNTYVSYLGDSITTFDGAIPADFLTYYPQGDVTSVDDCWWSLLTKKLQYTLLANDSYSGSKVTNGTMYGASVARLEYLSVNGIDPDVIFINMGTNDYSNGEPVKNFKSSYISMINHIRYMYDDVIIYVLNFPIYSYNGLDTRATEYNNTLKEIADSYNLKYVDIASLFDTRVKHSGNFYAGAHLNKAGMLKVADYIAELIKYKKI